MEDWVLYDYRESDEKRKPDEDKYIEIVFPSKIPAELLTNIFSFNQNKELPNWSFDKVYITFNDHSHTLQVIIFSIDGRKQITATIEKLETYEYLLSYFEEDKEMTEFVEFNYTYKQIYIPKNIIEMKKNKLYSSRIKIE